MGNKTSASKLRLARLEKHLSQEELAAKVRVTRTNVCHWERGKHNPSGAAQLLIARALRLPEDTVAGWFESERRTA